MNTLMGILRFVGKASLQILKTALSFAAGTVAAFCAFYGLVFLPHIARKPWLVLGRFAGKSLMVAAFAGGFYLTFKLLEPRMAARKKLLVATLGIVLLPASVFALFYTPTLDITEFFQRANLPGPPKPYEEAIYDVYSGLLIEEMTHRPLWSKLIDRIPEGVLIRIDTTIETRPGHGPGFEPRPTSLRGNMPQEQFDKAVSSAMADYAGRNKESFQLQRKFDLPKYELITTAEEYAALESCRLNPEGCREFMRKHHDYYRWVELSAVGFNENQTVAYLYMVEWRGGFAHGGYQALFKRNGKWYLSDGVFGGWVT